MEKPKAYANFLEGLTSILYHIQCRTKENDLVYSHDKKFLEELKSILLLFEWIFTPAMRTGDRILVMVLAVLVREFSRWSPI